MLFTELPTPSLFASAMKPITEDAIAKEVICGPDPEPYVERIEEAERAGYTHVCLHQVGPQQEEFIAFCEREILPAFGERTSPRRAKSRAAKHSRGGRRSKAPARRAVR
jgi:hypothetical protein